MKLSSITPNEAYDWINQRDNLFESFIPIEPEKKFNASSRSIFVVNSRGLETSRDSWIYNSSKMVVERNIQSSIEFFNKQVADYQNIKDKGISVNNYISYDSTKISWTSSLMPHVRNGNHAMFEQKFRVGLYRPFFKQHLYFGEKMIHRRGQFDNFFPTPQSKNLVICVGAISKNGLSALISNGIVDLHFNGDTQCFPLYYYEKVDKGQLGLFDSTEDEYIRRDAISDFILERARQEYGPKTTKEDIFYYVYGILNCEDYKKKFSSDLKKMLPRIPLVANIKDFQSFVKSGEKLASLHLNYEDGPFCPDILIKGMEHGNYRVEKMRFLIKNDKRSIFYNANIRIENIPQLAYEYTINGKSAIEWLMEKYQVSIHPESQILNDPNSWSEDPKYILNLMNKIIQLSLESLRIIRSMPRLLFE